MKETAIKGKTKKQNPYISRVLLSVVINCYLKSAANRNNICLLYQRL
nr:MAG TPA: hypothetical protein [Caudoviricetes sp.]